MHPLVKQKVSELLENFNRSFSLAIDVGCGAGDGGRIVRKYTDYLVGLDIDVSQVQKGVYDEVVVGDMRDVDYKNYDAVFMFDSIEHIPKEDGYKILDKIASFVMLTTPSFSLSLLFQPYLRWDGHECVYSASELESIGFEVREYPFNDLYAFVQYRSIIIAWRG